MPYALVDKEWLQKGAVAGRPGLSGIQSGAPGEQGQRYCGRMPYHSGMSRRHTACLVMLSLFVQALSLLLPWGQAHAAAETAHRFIHAQAAAHHHELDASLFLDAEDESAFHVHQQDSGQPLGMLPPVASTHSQMTCACLGAFHADRIASVFLEGPLRPPCLLV